MGLRRHHLLLLESVTTVIRCLGFPRIAASQAPVVVALGCMRVAATIGSHSGGAVLVLVEAQLENSIDNFPPIPSNAKRPPQRGAGSYAVLSHVKAAALSWNSTTSGWCAACTNCSLRGVRATTGEV